MRELIIPCIGTAVALGIAFLGDHFDRHRRREKTRSDVDQTLQRRIGPKLPEIRVTRRDSRLN